MIPLAIRTATRTLRQVVRLAAPPSAVYAALMDARRHAAFTGAAARIEPRVGGAFTVWDGYATGTTVQLEKDALIVQAWQTADWPEGAPPSRLRIRLDPDGGDGTKLTMTHSRVPADGADEYAQGWRDFYWTPLAAYLARPRRG